MKKRIIEFVVLLAVALGAAPLSAQMWKWSQTAATNASADPSINWAEGMSPSSVNDSARAMMSATARWRDDISGSLATAGTATAYTVTTNEGLQTPLPVDGQMISFTPNITNGLSVTLAVDGGTASAIQTSPGVNVGAGTLIVGTPYTAKFATATSSWILRDFYGNPYAIPLGGMMAYTGDTTPNSNFILPAGQCISRTTYASYFALVGSRFSSCDGSTTFGVPDFRGRVPVALNNLGGSSSGRLSTTYFGVASGQSGNNVGDVGGDEKQMLTLAQMPSHDHSASYAGSSGTLTYSRTDFTALQQYSGTGSFGRFVTGYSTVAVDGVPGGSVTVNPTGSNGFHPIMSPAMAVSYILRII
jgi:microcystin-dependent protein